MYRSHKENENLIHNFEIKVKNLHTKTTNFNNILKLNKIKAYQNIESELDNPNKIIFLSSLTQKSHIFIQLK